MLATQDSILFIPGNLVLLAVTILAAAIFLRDAFQLYRLMRLGRPEDRLDHLPDRVKGFIVYVLGQARLLTRPYPGLMHAFIFWGFLVITLGTIEIFGKGIFPGFALPLLDRSPVFLLLLDFFQVLVLVGLGMAAYRRLFIRPGYLNLSRDAWTILTLIFSLMVTDFVADATRIAIQPEPSDAWSPVGTALAGLFRGMDPGTVLAIHKGFWWAHVLILLGFLDYLPHSKHLHIVTAPFNVFFRSTQPRGSLPYVNVEEAIEKEQPLGVSRPQHLTWKDILDLYTCTECGRCESQCPAAITGKPLSPKWLVLDLKEYVLEQKTELLAGKDTESQNGKPMVGGAIADEVLWSCTTCRACMSACPVFIEHVPKIIGMRRHLAMEESRFSPELKRLYDNLESSGNPWRFPRHTRGDWAKDLGVKTMAEHPDAEVLYWVGCAGSHDERNVKVARAMARIMLAAGVDFAILGAEETCNGDPARRTGNEYLFQVLAQQNVETLNQYRPRRIVATCPHCFNTLHDEYPQFGAQFQVVHHTQFIKELLDSGRLRLTRPLPQNLTYHDPCYIGRYHDIYDAPRAVLDAIPGLQRKEMGWHGKRAMCCGAGGGWAFMEEKVGKRVNHLRVEQAMEVQPDGVATACPYCLMMFEDGTRAKGIYDTMPTRDIAEIVAEAIDVQQPAASSGPR